MTVITKKVLQKSFLKFNFSEKPAEKATKIGAIFLIEKNTNILTVQLESSTFASLSFDQGFPKKRLTTGPSSRSEHHLTVFCIDPIVLYFVNSLDVY